MEKYGFHSVSTEYITVNLTPDDPIYPKEMSLAMINANRKSAIDNIEGLAQIEENLVSSAEIEELKSIVDRKYDKRIELFENGIKQWDTNMSVTMIVRGIK